MDVCVRTGAINAGHSVFYNGKKYAMQTIPAGWVGGKRIKLVIGAGAFIKLELLEDEIKLVYKAMTGDELPAVIDFADMPFELYIDPKAGLHTKKHEEEEAGLHQRMGSTGKGCAQATIDKLKRDFEYKNFGDTEWAAEHNGKWFLLTDTVRLLNEYYDRGMRIVLEGTQGAQLDFFHGSYPYVTGRATNAAAWLAEAGLSPTMKNEVVMIVRTMPIRVAGNSGPMPGEISWADAARRIDPTRSIISEDLLQEFELMEAAVLIDWQMPEDPYTYNAETRKLYASELSALHNEVFKRLGTEKTNELRKILEITTVTKKLRRIADIDYDVLRQSAMFNRPTYIHLTFLNYMFPEVADCTTWVEIKEKVQAAGHIDEFNKFITDIEAACNVGNARPPKVRYVGTSPTRVIRVGKS